MSAKSYAGLAEIHSKENCKTFEEIEVDKLTCKKWAQQSDDYDSHLGIRREKPLQIAFPDKMGSKGPYWFLVQPEIQVLWQSIKVDIVATVSFSCP